MENVNIYTDVKEGSQALEILQGQALVRREPQSVDITGLIGSPYEYLAKRKDEIDPRNCHIIVDESSGLISLTIDEKSYYKDIIRGALKTNPDFEKFMINTSEARDTFELADFIKMYRRFFEDKNTAMELVSLLKNFKAKVNHQIEKSDNDRGNTRLLRDQVVDSNIPEAFDLVIPIFKGHPAEKFKVEISIDSGSFACRLISPDANDLIGDITSRLLGEQVDKILELIPGLVVIFI